MQSSVVSNDRSSDRSACPFSLIGLAADSGCLAGPLGIVTNAATARLKPALKKTSRAVAGGVARLDATLIKSLAIFDEYLRRLGDEPGVASAAWAVRLNKLEASDLLIDTDAVVASVGAVGKRNIVDIGDEASEGLAAFVKHGDPDAEQLDVMLEALEAHGEAAGGESARSIGQAIAKTYKRQPSGGVPDADDVWRVDDAVAAAGRSYDGHLRSHVNTYVGPERPFKTMEEFEALRHARAEDLSGEQALAIKVIRDSVGTPPVGTPVVKATNFASALQRITDGTHTMRGYYTRRVDLEGAESAGDVIDRLRLDYDASAFSAGESYAVIETTMTTDLVHNTQIPRTVWLRRNVRAACLPVCWQWFRSVTRRPTYSRVASGATYSAGT